MNAHTTSKETLTGLLRADPLQLPAGLPAVRAFPRADCPLGPDPDTSIIGNRSYTRAHFLYSADVVAPGTYR